MATYESDRDYADRIASMALVDTTMNEQGDEVFVVKFDGSSVSPRFADVSEACDEAARIARARGCKWDVTIQARNAADMS